MKWLSQMCFDHEGAAGSGVRLGEVAVKSRREREGRRERVREREASLAHAGSLSRGVGLNETCRFRSVAMINRDRIRDYDKL